MKVGLHRAKQEAWGELRGTGCHTQGIKACPQELRYSVVRPMPWACPALLQALSPWRGRSGQAGSALGARSKG